MKLVVARSKGCMGLAHSENVLLVWSVLSLVKLLPSRTLQVRIKSRLETPDA